MRAILLTIVLLFPLAAADETQPDCEPMQPWVGYLRTEPARAAYEAYGSPGGLAACEGEHWDGQDPTGAPLLACDLCLAEDPNHAASEDPLRPAAARASLGDGEVYVALNVAFVSRAALYADGSMVALYWRDNTPGNIVWNFRHIASVTGPPVSESDCSYATHLEGQMEQGGDWMCPRDNTAVTFEHGLLS